MLCCWEFIIFLTHFDNIQCTCILQTSISLLTVLTKTINNQYLLQRHLKFELLELQSLSSFTLYIPCPSKQYHNACMPTLALGHKTSKMSHTASIIYHLIITIIIVTVFKAGSYTNLDNKYSMLSCLVVEG